MQNYRQFLHDELKRHPQQSLLEVKDAEIEDVRAQLRQRLARKILGLREGRGVPRCKVLDEAVFSTFRREKLIIECEPESWQTALLYLPTQRKTTPAPGVLLASGHGGSKSHGYNQLAAQLYVQLGCVVLVGDPLGEDERHEPYGLGIRGHRHGYVVDRMNEAGRPFLGKLVTDLLAGLDYLRHRPEVDVQRLGCAGSSLGGTLVQLLVALEPGICAAVLSSWAANDRRLDGTVGCCYRLPGLLREAGQLELMALAAPECALLVCSGQIDEITPPYGLEAMGLRLRGWWRRRGAPKRFRCDLEANGGHRPYHNTERHHRGTRIPAWPLLLEPPEALRILDEPLLRSLSLEPRNFTLAGYLELQGIASLHPTPSLPAGASFSLDAAEGRIRKGLEELLAPQPAWTKTPLPVGNIRQRAEKRREYPLGFAQTNLRVCEGDAPHSKGILVLSRGRAEPITWKECIGATMDLVAFNDHETSLGQPSLFTNLHLVRRALAILRHEYPGVASWRLESWVPRLGELVFFCEPWLESLWIMTRQAVERATACNGRAENIVPGSAGRLYWVDLFLASAPRKIFLHSDYISSEAAGLLSSCHVTYFN